MKNGNLVFGGHVAIEAKDSKTLRALVDRAVAVLKDAVPELAVEQPVAKGSLVHIPPGVVHGARGRMRVLVVGIPDIAEDDYFEVSE